MLRILMGIVALGLLAIPAQAADIDHGYRAGYAAYEGSYPGLPVCDDGSVLASVSNKFSYYDARVIGSGLAIATISNVRETRLRVNGPSLIPRRYCDATATLSNGRRSEVVYLIEAHAGFASIVWNVQSCLPSFDPYRVYGAWCHSIRP